MKELLFSDRIAKLRKAKSMTQEDLGAIVGVSGQAVSKWEAGGMPDPELLPNIAKALGCSIDSLYGCEKKPGDMNEDEFFDFVFTYCLSVAYKGEGSTQMKQWYFPFLMELCWTAQCAYWGNEERMPLKETFEKYKGNDQISSQVINDYGTSYLSLTEDFPLFYMMQDHAGISQKILSEELFVEFFNLFSDTDSYKVILYGLTSAESSHNSEKAFCEKTGISRDKFRVLRPLLIKFGFINEEQIVLDDKELKTYRTSRDPQIVPMLMIAYGYIHKRQCFYNFISERSKPFLERK